MPDDQIHIESVHIENVFGVREVEFSPNGVTLIRGDNETGKTSILRAIALLLGGGQNPNALREGAESGEVRFVLDDGTEVYASLTEKKIYYRIGETGSSVDGDLTARQLLDQIQDEISVNPIQILQSRPEERSKILLEAMPMTVDPYAFEEAVSPLQEVDVGKPVISGEQHALKALGDESSGAIGELYEKRQEIYGAKRDKKGAISDLEKSVEQHDDPEDLKEERTHIEQELEDLRAQKQDALDEVNEWEKAKIEKIREQAEDKREGIREEADEDIRQQEAQRERLNEKIEQAEKAEQTKEIIEERKEEHAELEDRYSRLTESIENLRSLKIDFAEDLPEGVRIDDDGEIVGPEGIRFEYWNEERKVRFAAKIAEMRRGPLGIIPVDGIEALVGEQRTAFLDWAQASDAQFVLTEAAPGEDLTIEHP